jgi:lysine 2,3-aminomutase
MQHLYKSEEMMINISKFNPTYIQAEAPEIFTIAKNLSDVDELRASLSRLANDMMFETFDDYDSFSEGSVIRVRDCAKVMIRLMTRRSEDMANFSVAQSVMDIAHEKKRADLTPAFYAELLYLLLGLQGRGPGTTLADLHLIPSRFENREAALERSRQLDELHVEVQWRLSKFTSGLDNESIKRRKERRLRLLDAVQGSESDWNDWKWHIQHILRDADEIARLLNLSKSEYNAIKMARKNKIPFGITPYYLSLMDDQPEDGRDRAIRAQVIPSGFYVEKMAEAQRFGHAIQLCELRRSPRRSSARFRSGGQVGQGAQTEADRCGCECVSARDSTWQVCPDCQRCRREADGRHGTLRRAGCRGAARQSGGGGRLCYLDHA